MGVFAGPKNNRRHRAMHRRNGNDLINYFAANTPYASITITPGESQALHMECDANGQATGSPLRPARAMGSF